MTPAPGGGLYSAVLFLENGRAIGALRQPDRLRRAAEVTLIRLDSGVKLRVNRRVSRQQRQIAVRCGAGGDLDVALILQRAKGGEEVAVEPILERGQNSRVPVVIEARQVPHDRIAGLLETLDVLGRARRAFRGIPDEVVDDERIGELLGEHRRDPDREPERDAFVAQIEQGAEQRHVGLCGCLVDPFFTVWPHSCLAGVREMAMQHEGECAIRTVPSDRSSVRSRRLPRTRASLHADEGSRNGCAVEGAV